MTEIIQSAISHFFEWLLSGLLDGLFNICKAIIDQANQSLPIVKRGMLSSYPLRHR